MYHIVESKEGKKRYLVSGVFGEALSRAVEEKKIPDIKKMASDGQVLFRFFDTPKEAESYIQGLDDMDGWLGFMLTDYQLHGKAFRKVRGYNFIKTVQ